LRDKKNKYSKCGLVQKKFLNEAKNHNPPLQVKWSVPNGQPSHGGDRKFFEVMTSTLSKGTLVSVTSLLAATLYQGNPDRNHKL